MFKFSKGKLDGTIVVEPDVFSDNRGSFQECYVQEIFQNNGITATFVQDNMSFSCGDVIRGMHFQFIRPQAKLVRVIKGKIFDVAIDIRPGSPTFGKWEGIFLSQENRLQFYIPVGFAHGFQVVSKEAIVQYKCSDYYCKEGECGIHFRDPDLRIAWQKTKKGKFILSPKDLEYRFLWELDKKILQNFAL